MSTPPPPPRRHNYAIVTMRESNLRSSSLAAAPHIIDANEPESGVVYRAGDFEHSVHLDAQGNVLAGNGTIDELASLAAYVCRIASVVGQQLSFGDMTGIETTLSTGTFFMQRDTNGEIVSIKPRSHLNLTQLRTQLNL